MLGRLKLLFTNLSLQLKNFVGVLCDGFELWESASPPNGQRPKVIEEIWPNGRKKTEVINAPQKRRVTTPQNGDFFPPKNRFFQKGMWTWFFENLWGLCLRDLLCLVGGFGSVSGSEMALGMEGRNGWMMGSWNGTVNKYCKWLGCNACWYLQIKSYLYYPYSPMSTYDIYIFIYTVYIYIIYIYRLL